MADLKAPPLGQCLDFTKLNGFGVEKLYTLAQAAERAERHREMCHYMKTIVDKQYAAGKELSTEERNLLSVAYKNVVASQRQAWRSVEKDYNIWTGEPKKDAVAALNPAHIKKWIGYIEEQLGSICQEVLDLLNNGPLKPYKGIKKEDLPKTLKDAEKDEKALAKKGEEVVFFL